MSSYFWLAACFLSIPSEEVSEPYRCGFLSRSFQCYSHRLEVEIKLGPSPHSVDQEMGSLNDRAALPEQIAGSAETGLGLVRIAGS